MKAVVFAVALGSIYASTGGDALAAAQERPHASVEVPRGLKSTDVRGFHTGMTLQEVSARVRLEPLGRGEFSAVQGDTKFDFGFTPLGRLYRIDSFQTLRPFAADYAMTARLTQQLTAKFGPPGQNQLPGGPASWSYSVPVVEANGARTMRPAQTLSVMFQGGSGGGPVQLWIKLLDFPILWADQARMNSGPKAAAEQALRF